MSSPESEIREIADRIARLVSDAYKRGETDAIDRLVRAARSESDNMQVVPAAASPSEERPREARKRAPKGAVDVLVTRALGNGSGKKPDEIKALAATDNEQMVALPSIRAHLRKGEKEGRYRKQGNRWYAIHSVEEETTAPATQASDSDPGREPGAGWKPMRTGDFRNTRPS